MFLQHPLSVLALGIPDTQFVIQPTGPRQNLGPVQEDQVAVQRPVFKLEVIVHFVHQPQYRTLSTRQQFNEVPCISRLQAWQLIRHCITS